jgi:hypothetical protein
MANNSRKSDFDRKSYGEEIQPNHADQVGERRPASTEGSTSRLPSPNCVIKVGAGRGFIIVERISTAGLKLNRRSKLRLRPFVNRPLVVTAAHCLPNLPPAHAFSYTEERTYSNLLGRLHNQPNVWAECLFVDPVADIALLGCPDGQELYEEAEAYEALIADTPALTIARARSGNGWLLALDGAHWVPTKLLRNLGLYGASLLTGPTESGMSGSPILNNRGHAVGVVVIGGEIEGRDGTRVYSGSGPQPILRRNLPGWLLPD